jgi:hypothetical protein
MAFVVYPLLVDTDVGKRCATAPPLPDRVSNDDQRHRHLWIFASMWMQTASARAVSHGHASSSIRAAPANPGQLCPSSTPARCSASSSIALARYRGGWGWCREWARETWGDCSCGGVPWGSRGTPCLFYRRLRGLQEAVERSRWNLSTKPTYASISTEPTWDKKTSGLATVEQSEGFNSREVDAP